MTCALLMKEMMRALRGGGVLARQRMLGMGVGEQRKIIAQQNGSATDVSVACMYEIAVSLPSSYELFSLFSKKIVCTLSCFGSLSAQVV